MTSDAFVNWKQQNQITPIFLTGGLAASQGGTIPIVNLTNPGGINPSQGNFLSSVPAVNGITTVLLSVASAAQVDTNPVNPQLDNTGVSYIPVSGGTLISNTAAVYPFANQAVAANATIAQPLNISMSMLIPATVNLSYPARRSLLMQLVSSLKIHINLGGLFSVVTPAFIYTNCILLTMRDVSGGETNQAQYRWQFDFFQPLVTQQQANQAQNGLIQAITNGYPIAGSPSYATGLPVTNPNIQGLVPSGVPITQGATG